MERFETWILVSKSDEEATDIAHFGFKLFYWNWLFKWDSRIFIIKNIMISVLFDVFQVH